MDCVDNLQPSEELTEGEAESRLKEKLNKVGIMTDEQYGKLDKKDKFLLLEIFNVVTARQINRANSLKAFKEQAIKVSAVATQITSSRRTLYNKGFAMELIEKIQEEEEKADPFKRIDALKEELDELTKMIVEMKIRDVTVETLKSNIEKLNHDLTDRIQAYNTLEDDNFNLLKRIAELEGLDTKVVGMRKKSKKAE